MKLRNKKTGEIGDLMGTERSCPYITIGVDFHDGNPRAFDYKSLAELNEEWEDVKVKEPLIKDEKIRKLLRMWADVNDEKEINVTGGGLATLFQGLHTRLDIELCCAWTRNGIYNITELCGEEER